MEDRLADGIAIAPHSRMNPQPPIRTAGIPAPEPSVPTPPVGPPATPVDVPPLPPTPQDPTGVPPAIDDPDAPGSSEPVREPGRTPPAVIAA